RRTVTAPRKRRATSSAPRGVRGPGISGRPAVIRAEGRLAVQPADAEQGTVTGGGGDARGRGARRPPGQEEATADAGMDAPPVDRADTHPGRRRSDLPVHARE